MGDTLKEIAKDAVKETIVDAVYKAGKTKMFRRHCYEKINICFSCSVSAF